MTKNSNREGLDIDTLALHGFDRSAIFGSETDIAPAIHLSTTFRREMDGTYPAGYSYTRRENPNRTALEETLAALEGGSDAACFASGSAATLAVFQGLRTGDHVVVARDTYHGTATILRSIMARWGLVATFVDATNVDAVRAAIRSDTSGGTALIWIETPSNPLMHITDIAAIAQLARDHGAGLVADNTVATSVLQSPLALGCDLVVHSTTKYIAGHSDVLGGVVVAVKSSELFGRIREVQNHGGAVPSPFDCWLALRGVRTMPQRVRAQSANALRVARFLRSRAGVAAVHYAGLEDHPQHALAARQMRGFGGLLSFEVTGGEREAFAVAAGTSIISRATSLGGVESTIEQRASMEGAGTTTPPNLLRLSVGIESVDDLVADLDKALRVIAP